MADKATAPPICETLISFADWAKLIIEPESFCEKVVLHTLKDFNDVSGTIDVMLCDNEKMRELNSAWRNLDKPTNVLSFEQVGNPNLIGSIALGFEICAQEALDQGKEFENHTAHLLVHGVLHLMGYDHIEKDEADEMEELEIQILAKLGIGNPYSIVPSVDVLNSSVIVTRAAS